MAELTEGFVYGRARNSFLARVFIPGRCADLLIKETPDFVISDHIENWISFKLNDRGEVDVDQPIRCPETRQFLSNSHGEVLIPCNKKEGRFTTIWSHPVKDVEGYLTQFRVGNEFEKLEIWLKISSEHPSQPTFLMSRNQTQLGDRVAFPTAPVPAQAPKGPRNGGAGRQYQGNRKVTDFKKIFPPAKTPRELNEDHQRKDRQEKERREQQEREDQNRRNGDTSRNVYRDQFEEDVGVKEAPKLAQFHSAMQIAKPLTAKERVEIDRKRKEEKTKQEHREREAQIPQNTDHLRNNRENRQSPPQNLRSNGRNSHSESHNEGYSRHRPDDFGGSRSDGSDNGSQRSRQLQPPPPQNFNDERNSSDNDRRYWSTQAPPRRASPLQMAEQLSPPQYQLSSFHSTNSNIQKPLRRPSPKNLEHQLDQRSNNGSNHGSSSSSPLANTPPRSSTPSPELGVSKTETKTHEEHEKEKFNLRLKLSESLKETVRYKDLLEDKEKELKEIRRNGEKFEKFFKMFETERIRNNGALMDAIYNSFPEVGRQIDSFFSA